MKNALASVTLLICGAICGLTTACTSYIRAVVASSCSSTVQTVSLSPIYPVNGRNWMDWVHVSNASLGPFSQPDMACAGTEAQEWDCIDGGDKLQVPVPSLSTCTGVTAKDTLGAFDWTCEVKNGEAYIYSEDLKWNKGLKNLINSSGTGFLDNSVEVYQNNCEVAATASTAWWSNAFSVLTSNAGSGLTSLSGAAGTIYTVPTSSATGGVMTTDGFNLAGDKLAIVVMSGVTLQWAGSSTDNIDSNYGYSVSGSNDLLSVVSAGHHNYDWVEGTFNDMPSSGTQGGASMFRSEYFLSVRDSTFENSTGAGLWTWYCHSCFFQNIYTNNDDTGGTSTGLYDDSGTGGFLDHLYAANNVTGLGINETSGFAENLFSSNNSNAGISMGTSTTYVNVQSSNDAVTGLGGGNNNIIVQATVTNSGDYGWHSYSSGDTLVGGTFANINLYAIHPASGANNNTFVNVAATNSKIGIFLDGSTNSAIYNSAVTDDQTGIEADASSTGNAFYNYVLIGNNSTANCTLNSAGASPGFVTTTCTSGGSSGAGTNGSGGSTTNWGGGGNLSTAYLYTPYTLASSFIGKVTTTDTSNSTNTNGLEAYTSALDWFDFSTILRGWGVDGGAFPSTTNYGRCSSGNCRIWDWRLSKSDTVLRNASLNGDSQNQVFVPGATCPQAVNGNTAVTDPEGHIFLPNAMEINFDYVHNPNGNNNGLCESNEACIYMPNIGSYQGEGDPFSQAPCIFQNGTVTNVTMYAYPTNGG